MIYLSGITELAKLFKERDNSAGYSPIIGQIIDLPNIKIRLNDRVILTSAYLKSCVDLTETDENGIKDATLFNSRGEIEFSMSNPQYIN